MNINEKAKLTFDLGRKYYPYYVLSMKISMSDMGRNNIPKLILGHDASCYQDSINNIIHLGLGMFINYSDGTYQWDTEEEFNGLVQYVRGHEEQHKRSTTQRAWMWGQNNGMKAILEEMSKKYEPHPRRFTKESDIDNFINNVLPTYGIKLSKSALQSQVHFLMNSIEDGRIERLRAKKNYGFRSLMKWARGRMWKHTPIPEDLDVNNPKEYLLILMNQLLTLATTGVYQKGFIKTYGDTSVMQKIYQITPLIIKGVKSGTCKQGMQYSIEICRLLAVDIAEACKITPMEQFMQNLLSQIAQQMSGQENFNDNEEDKDGSSNYDTSENSEETGENATENVTSDSQNKAEEANGEDEASGNESSLESINIFVEGSDGDESTDSGAGANGSPASTSDEKSDKKKSKDGKSDFSAGGDSGSKGQSLDPNAVDDREEIEKMMEDAVSASINLSFDGVKQITASAIDSVNQSGSMTEKEVVDNSKCPDVSDICKNFNEFTRKYQITDEMPSDAKMRGVVLHNKYKRYFQSLYTPQIRGTKAGCIDAKRLYKVAVKKYDVFMKKAKDSGFDGCVEILVDHSGSMGCGDGSKCMHSMVAAGIIEEAFKGLMPIKIVAFDSGGRVNHEIIKNWDDKFKKNCCWNYYTHCRSGGGTPTAYSLKIAERELLERPEQHKLLILLTDESYYCAGDGLSGIIQQVRKSGITLVGIYFENTITPDAANGFDQLFGGLDNIAVTPREIDGELTRIVERFARQ